MKHTTTDHSDYELITKLSGNLSKILTDINSLKRKSLNELKRNLLAHVVSGEVRHLFFSPLIPLFLIFISQYEMEGELQRTQHFLVPLFFSSFFSFSFFPPSFFPSLFLAFTSLFLTLFLLFLISFSHGLPSTKWKANYSERTLTFTEIVMFSFLKVIQNQEREGREREREREKGAN